MRIDNIFSFGQILYLKTDIEQLPRMLVGIQACADGGILYKLTQGDESTWHYEVEISDTKDILLVTTN